MSTLEKLAASALVLLLAVLAMYGAFTYSKHLGKEELRTELAAQAKVIDAKREAIATPIAAKQEAAQVQIRTITKTILKEVPVYVKADDCPMSPGFRVLHDAAANGQFPDPAGVADAAPVPAQDVAESVVDNYGACHETAARLLGLQEWVSAQKALK